MIRKFILLSLTTLIYCNLTAQQTYPNTFLWRITGNGLSKPSYLYGTMHLQDRKLFSFGDSIYHAIESSDGFAIEVDPAEMMDSLFKIFAKPDNSPLIKKILSKSEYDKVADRLSKKLKIPADQITTKKIADDKRNWLYKYKQKSDMPTFMDMYLYSIAQNQGKYVSGIEDLEDQIGLLDDVGGLNIEEYLNEDDKGKLEYLNRMKTIYINRDLNKLQEVTYGDRGTAFHDLLLKKRNIKMAKRMDSLSHIRNSFFAVGAAHLPGDSGLITLLKKRGFVVEPVTSANYLKPEDYHYTKKDILWIKIEDEHKMFSAKMPGQPTLVNISGVIPMQMYLDLSNIFCYGIAVIPTVSEVNPDSVFLKIIDSYKSLEFEIISTKKIEELNAKGIEIKLKNSDGYFRFKLLLRSNKLFMLIFGAQDDEKLGAPEQVRFFSSFIINETNLTQQTTWQLFSDKQNAFSVLTPGNTTLKFDKGTKEILYDVYTYTVPNYSDGSYYMIVVKNLLPGYFINGDSLLLAECKRNFSTFTDTATIQISKENFNGGHSYRIRALKKLQDKEYAFQLYMIIRGNRIYFPMAITEKGRENSEEVKNFFKSFALLPYQQSQWELYRSPANNFSSWAPANFEFKKIDSSTTIISNKQYLFAYDKNSVIGYNVEVQPYSSYYWSNSDSVFFKKLSDSYRSDEDSLIYYHLLSGDTTGAEILIKIHNSGLHKRLRTLLNGDTLYTLYTYVPEEMTENKDVNLFFTSFKFTNPQPNTIFNKKEKRLIAALQSPDSAIRVEALEVLDQIDFTKKDIDFLHQAWLKSYPADPNSYRSVNYAIEKKIKNLNDSLTIDFIDENYSKFDSKLSYLQMDMLEVLGEFKTAKSYAVLKKLLLSHPLSGGSVYNLSNALHDSLLLSAKLFPEVSRLYSDSIIGSTLIRLTVNLADSGLLNLNNVKENAELIYLLSRKQLKKIKVNPNAYPLYNNYVIDILEKINTKQSIELLKSFLQVSDITIKYNAALALIKLNQFVSGMELLKLAADKEYRTALYSSLRKMKKANLFPKEFYTQQKFAESYVYNYVREDEDSVSLRAIAERISKIQGRLKRYYLFKLNTMKDDQKSSHLVICGPFDVNKLNVENSDEEIDIHVFYDEVYNPSTTEKLFQQFIKSGTEK